MTDQIRNLDFQMIERASEKYENLREVVVAMEIDGEVETFIIEIYKHFAPIQITMCIQELVEKLDAVGKRDKKGIGGVFVPYMMFLLIKHFTTLKMPNSFPEQLQAIKHMTNTGVMFQIFMHMDEEQLEKINDEVINVVEQFDGKWESTTELREKVKSLLVDKTLLE